MLSTEWVAQDQNLQQGQRNIAPEHFQAILRKGDLLLRQGNPDAAEAIFREVIALLPNHSVASLRLVKILLTAERLAEAETVLRALPDTVADHLQVLLWLGDVRFRQGDFIEAEATFRKVLALRPGYSVAVLRLVKILINTEQWMEAEAALHSLPDTIPEHLQVLLWLGDLRQRQGDNEETEVIFRKAVSLHPGHVGASLRLAKVLIKTEQWAEAETVLRSLPNTTIEHLQILLWLADVLQRQDKMVEAEAVFRRVTVIRPDHAGAAIRLSKILVVTGRLDAGRAALVKFLEAWPDNSEVMIALGHILSTSHQDAAAIPLFERALTISPSSISAWLGLVRSSAKHISVSAALELLYAAKRKETHPQLDLELVSLFLRAGRISEAEEAAVSAAQCYPDHTPVQSMRIKLDIMAGRYDNADAGIRHMSKATPQETVDALRLLGGLEKARWRIDSAIETYREILASSRSGPQDHRALAEALMLTMNVSDARRHLVEANRLQAARLRAEGKSMNVSQALPGEILNDFCTDPSAIAAGLKAQNENSVEAWIHAADGHPNHTGCAIGFFIHLRQAGRLEAREPSYPSYTIPHHVHQLWDTASVPDDVAELMESWRAHNRGWIHTLYSLSDATKFLDEMFPENVSRAFCMAGSIAGKADIFRLAVLLRLGGVYADADDRCVASLAPLIKGRSLVLRQEHFGSIGNNFIAVSSNHPIIGQALDQVVDAILRGDRDSIWLSSGPGLMTRAAANFLSANACRLHQLGDEILINDDHDLRRFCASGCHASYKYTERNWQHVEFDRARDLTGAVLQPLRTINIIEPRSTTPVLPPT